MFDVVPDTTDQAARLEEAFIAIHGEKPPRLHGGTKELEDWLHRHNPFYNMLKCKAYESAALSLLPEGWWIHNLSTCICEPSCSVNLFSVRGEVTGFGPTMAMALIDAILKIN